MDKLNELVKRAEKADALACIMTAVNPHDILAIAEAFRELEQRAEEAESSLDSCLITVARYAGPRTSDRERAETAEAQLAELAKQKPVAVVEESDYATVVEMVEGNRRKAIRELQEDSLQLGMELFTRPAPAAVPVDLVPDYFDRLVVAARARAEKAMRKFPQPNYVLNKVAEESGEVIKAVIHYTEGREDWLSVEGELIDNLAMLFRLVTEGDGVIGFSPPEEVVRRIEGRQC